MYPTLAGRRDSFTEYKEGILMSESAQSSVITKFSSRSSQRPSPD